MKPMKVDRNTLLGGFFLLLGITFALKLLFGIDFPVFRVLIALGFIYLGVRLVTGRAAGGRFASKDQETVAFGDAELKLVEESREPHGFSVICSRAVIDLAVPRPERDFEPEIDVHVVAGLCVIHYNPARPTWIQAHSFLADVAFPDGNSAVLGTINWRTPGLEPGGRCMRVKVNAGLARVQLVPKLPER